jgi:hypothetical protein
MRRAGRHTFSQTIKVKGNDPAAKILRSKESAENAAEGVARFEAIVARLNQRSLWRWQERLILMPDRADPLSWNGRVSGRMRTDWEHAENCLDRDLVRLSLAQGAAMR